jgi:hypothetical protein
MPSDNKTFSFEDLEKIVDRISKLKTTEQRETIRDIIKKHNPDLNITENKNGLWIHFDNLNNQTYIDINNFLKKVSKAKIVKTNSETVDSDSITSHSVDEYPYSNNSKLKYSNKERNIIKRNLYDKEINGEETGAKEKLNFNNESSKLFVKKTK